uniref:Probable protein S-acyltransferase 23 n=1 Tax=Callorhinchus milii TaxID=7868 RepID=A0A4W3J782_CALMI
MDILLEAGVWLDERDHRGCTALIIAAQYGHITLCCYLMGKGASLQMCDHEGDSALHWAAFHGHCELTRLLIYSGFDPRQPDAFANSYVLIAARIVNSTSFIFQDGIALETEDINGNIPLKLARSRQNKDIVMHLEKTIGQSNSLIPRFDWSALRPILREGCSPP